MRIAVLGAGTLGESLIRGLLDSGSKPADFVVTAGHRTRVETLERSLGVSGAASNLAAVQGADLVILSVKPPTVPGVLDELRAATEPLPLLVSVAASVRIADLEAHLPAGTPVVRAMPNTPSLVKRGMTVLSRGRHATNEHLERACQVFDAVGRTMVLDEKHLDAVTGLSACGPAFIYIVIESLAEAGVKTGLPRDVATVLAAQTVLGAGAMVLETGEHPARLKDLVTTPAGCTVDGILELEEGGLRVTLIKAVVKSAERARALRDGAA
jgi:pyrroline-5-carboxylate reductase